MTKNILWCCGLLAISLISSAESFAGKPITLNIEQLETLPADRQQVLRAVINAFNEKKYIDQSDFQPQLPNSRIQLPEGGQIIQFSDLFKRPTDSDDLWSLATDPSGTRKRLTDDQYSTFRRGAYLKVASVVRPGRYHVWEVRSWLQKGSDKIKITFQENAAGAVGHILVEIPDNLVSHRQGRWSVRKGMTNLVYGMRGILSNVVGLIEERATFSENDIQDLIRKKKEEYITTRLGQPQSGLNAQAAFDLRLYSEELRDRLAPDVHRIEEENRRFVSEQDASWRKESLRQIRLTFPEYNSGQLESVVRQELQIKQFEALNQRLREDVNLSNLAPGFGVLLAHQRTAARIAQEVEIEFQQEISKKIQELRELYKKDHAILSRVDGWVEPRVKKEAKDFERTQQQAYLNKVPEKLELLGLTQEAAIAREVMKFNDEELAPLRAELGEEKVAANSKDFQYRIWRSKNWIPKEVKDSRGNVEGYLPEKYEKSQVFTDQWLWRLRIFGHRSVSNFKNGLFGIVSSNLWNGPLGLKAMNPFRSTYCSGHRMNQATGQIEEDPDQTCDTYLGNLQGITRDYHAACDAYNREPDRGIFSKRFLYYPHLVKQNAIWTMRTAFTGLLQPLATVSNVCVSGALVAAAPVWAPLSSIFMAGLNSLIYDFDYPGSSDEVGHSSHQGFPLLQYCLGDVACAGVGMAAFETGKTALFDGTTAPLVRGIYAYTRKIARSTWDGAVGLAAKRLAYIPAEDGRTVTRTAGPGKSGEFYYQIQPELAILALQAVLEKDELSLSSRSQERQIHQPVQNFYAFFDQIAQPMTLDPRGLEMSRTLVNERDNNSKKLNDQLAIRKKYLNSISIAPSSMRSSIKLKRVDLQTTLNKSQYVVKSFYTENILQYLDEAAKDRFWLDKFIEEDDFEGLTRFYYAQVFDNDFFVPLEVRDDDFVVEVQEPSLIGIFNHFPSLL